MFSVVNIIFERKTHLIMFNLNSLKILRPKVTKFLQTLRGFDYKVCVKNNKRKRRSLSTNLMLDHK
jgi:hypothetical protein